MWRRAVLAKLTRSELFSYVGKERVSPMTSQTKIRRTSSQESLVKEVCVLMCVCPCVCVCVLCVCVCGHISALEVGSQLHA